MLSPQALFKGIVQRILPTPTVDGPESEGLVRLNRYREVAIGGYSGSRHHFADEGSYFVATNATPGTALLYTLANFRFSDTNPFMYIYNQENVSSPNSRSIYLDYLKLMVDTAATTQTETRITAILDPVNRPLTGTDNMTVITPRAVNPVLGIPNTLLLKMQNSATASTITASSVNKIVAGQGNIASGVQIVGDELLVAFGVTDVGTVMGLTAAQAVQPKRVGTNLPPIIIPPGYSCTFSLGLNGNATTALQYEFELAGWFR